LRAPFYGPLTMSVTGYALSLAGGVLIGLATSALLYTHGRLAGISGIVGGALYPASRRTEWPWRAAFILGLVLSGLTVRWLEPDLFGAGASGSVPLLFAAGVLAGFGARLGGGCTSGHGVCGLGSLSVRSLVATGTFMSVAALVVFVTRHVFGRSP
jgi:uncharacterized membrane protein YedE/YeeE